MIIESLFSYNLTSVYNKLFQSKINKKCRHCRHDLVKLFFSFLFQVSSSFQYPIGRNRFFQIIIEIIHDTPGLIQGIHLSTDCMSFALIGQ